MQSRINNEVQFGQALNPLKNVAQVSSIDNTSDLQDVFTKIDKLKKLWDDRSMDYDLIRYLPGMAKISRQGQIYSVHPQRVYASPNWSDLKTFEFSMLLTADTATNFNNMHLCIPLQIKKSTNTANDLDDDLITVNNFFVHFIKEIDIRRYGDEIRILPTNNTVIIYRYSDAMLKHMLDDALKAYDKTLYSKKAVKLANNVDRRPNNTDNNRAGNNLDDWIDKFHDLLGKKRYTEYL